MMRILMPACEVTEMRTTINIDEELVEEARKLTGIDGQSALFKEGLLALVQRESARRLAALGGSAPNLQDIPRRRPWIDGAE